MAILNSLFSLLALLEALVIPTTFRGQLPENHVAFFVFGDSLLDAGNNQYLNGTPPKNNYWPYGETYFHHATGRVCDGRIVPDFIAQKANLPFIPPYLQPGLVNYTHGVNFASAGAGVFKETSPETIHLQLQLSYFEEMAQQLKQQLGDAQARRLLSKAVYLFSIGGNDYIKLTSDPSIVLTPIDELKYVGMVLGNFTTVIKAIYNKGGRKFAFQNVGPLGCMPATTSMAPKNSTIFKCVEEPQTIARLHNAILSKLLERLAIQLPEFKYSLFDYHTSLAERTLSPFKFGFKIGENACCGSGRHNGHFTCGQENYTLCSNPGEHVWFDAGHPTESTNKQLADLLWSGHPNVTAPYTLKMFFEM